MWVAALVVGGLSLLGGIFGANSRKKDAERKKAEAERVAAEERKRQEMAFAIEKEDAFKKSDLMNEFGERLDVRTTEQESLIGSAYNQSMKQLGMSQEQMALQEQSAKLGMEQQSSALQAAYGASGVRSGSTQENVLQQQEEYGNQQLDFNRRAADMQTENALLSAYSGLWQSSKGVEDARTSANKSIADATQLKSDYSEGGRATNLFNQGLKVADIKAQFNADAWQREADRNDFFKSPVPWFNSFGDFFGGASAGIGMAYSYNQAKDFFQLKKSTTPNKSQMFTAPDFFRG